MPVSTFHTHYFSHTPRSTNRIFDLIPTTATKKPKAKIQQWRIKSDYRLSSELGRPARYSEATRLRSAPQNESWTIFPVREKIRAL
jgi:hypothetical protein